MNSIHVLALYSKNKENLVKLMPFTNKNLQSLFPIIYVLLLFSLYLEMQKTELLNLKIDLDLENHLIFISMGKHREFSATTYHATRRYNHYFTILSNDISKFFTYFKYRKFKLKS